MEIQTKKAWSAFDRQRLRKIYILIGTDDTIQIRTKILNKKTLAVATVVSFMTKETFETVDECLILNKEIFSQYLFYR